MSETQTTAPTPGPWRIGRNPSAYDEIYGGPGGGPVGYCDTGDPAKDRANAAHIVKCVNEYPGLLARAERLASAVQHLSEVSDDALVYGISDDDARRLRDAWGEINDALAALKAGG